MPKTKTKKSFKNRFKVTPRGKVVTQGSYSSHLKEKKRKSRLRRQKEPIILNKTESIKVKRQLGLK